MREMEFERNPLNHGARFRNIIEMRNIKYCIWRAKLSAQPRLLCVSFDEFLKDYLSIVQRVASLIEQPLPDPIILPKGYKGRMSWRRRLLHMASMGLLGDKRKLTVGLPLKSKDIDFVLMNIDKKQEQYWCFNVESLAVTSSSWPATD